MRLTSTPIVCIFSLWIPFGLFQTCEGNAEYKPIVDVQFDGPYEQIDSSLGDEWAPTWGRADILYTGSDDGSNFGDIPDNAILFGRLEGNDPYQLKGTTINGLREFQEQPKSGPDGAMWKTMDSYEVDGVRYRFAVCDAVDRTRYTCFVTSIDGGKNWIRRQSGSGKPAFSWSQFAIPFFIAYRREMENLMFAEPGKYVYAASYAGVIGGEDTYLVARTPKTRLVEGDAADWEFRQSFASWGALDKAVPVPNTGYGIPADGTGPDGANWKLTNSYSVDGVLYMFITRCSYPSASSDAKHRHVFQNSSIIKSADDGRTWTRTATENYDKPMFPGGRFGAPYFVWYGKDGMARADNADKYVYAISNNGYFENGDNFVLGRVLRSKLPNLSAADWSFYRSGNGMKDGSWTSLLDQATPVLVNEGKSSMTGMTYIQALHRYIVVAWHYHHDNFDQAIASRDLATVLEFFEAPTPWGPWNKVKTFDTGRLGWYAPIIGQRFQKSSDTATVTAFLYATGFYNKPDGGVDLSLYKLNYVPIRFSTKQLQQKDPAFVGGR